jgi:hypothetical protein
VGKERERRWEVGCRMWMYEREPDERHPDTRAFDRSVTDGAMM